MTSAMAAQSLHTAHSLILLAPGALSLAPAVDVVAGGSLGQRFSEMFSETLCTKPGNSGQNEATLGETREAEVSAGRRKLSRILQRHRSCTSDARGHSEVQQTLILDGSTSELGLARRARKETGVRNWPTSKRICGPNPPLGRGGCVQHQVDRSGERPSRGKETPSDADHGAGAGAKRPHGRVAPLT